MFQGLNLLILRAPDIDALAGFYTRLGLAFTAERHGNGPRHFAAALGVGGA